MQVGDGIEHIDVATDGIIATMKAFGMTVAETSNIVDKLNEVSNKTSVTTGDLVAALTRGGSALSLAGNSLEESIGLIVAGNETVRNAESVGNALKVISLRTRGAKDQLEEYNEEVDQYVRSSSKMRAKILEVAGVDIMENDATFKSTFQILKEISEVYDSLSDIDRANVLEALFGKNRASVGASILQNFDQAQKAVDAASNSYGSATKEHENWAKGIEASEARAAAAFEEFSYKVMNSDIIKFVYDAGGGILGFLSDFIDLTGSAVPLVASLSAGAASLYKNIGLLSVTGNTENGFAGMFKWNLPFNIKDIFKSIAEKKGEWVEDILELDELGVYNLFGEDTPFDEWVKANEELVKETIEQSKKPYRHYVNYESEGSLIDDVAESFKRADSGAKNLTESTKGATIAAQALSTAVNMVLVALISWAATKAFQWLDENVINAQKHLDEAADEANEAYAEQVKVVDNLNSEIEKTQDRIKELQALGVLSVVEQEELDRLKETNAELELQYKWEKRRLGLSNKEANKATAKAVRGHYGSTSTNPFSEYGRPLDPVRRVLGNRIYDYDIDDERIWTLGSIIQMDMEALPGLYKERAEIIDKLRKKDVNNATAEEIAAWEAEKSQIDKEISETENQIWKSIEYYDSMLENASYIEGATDVDQQAINQMFEQRNIQMQALMQFWDPSSVVDYLEENYSDTFSGISKWFLEHVDATNEEIEAAFPDIIDLVKAWIPEEDYDTALQYIREKFSFPINESDIVANPEDISAGLYQNTEAYKALTTALAEQESQGYLTLETYEALIAADEEYAKMLVKTADGYMINVEAAQEYVDKMNNIARLDALTNIKRINEEIASLDPAGDADRIAELEQERAYWGLIVDEINRASGAMSKWQQAKKTQNGDEWYSEGKSMYEYVKENRKIGKIGTDDYAAALEFALGEGAEVNKKNGERAENILERYFGQKSEGAGLAYFIEDSKAKGILDANDNIVEGMTLEGWAENLGVSTDLVRTMLDLAKAYGVNIDYLEVLNEEEEREIKNRADAIEALGELQDEKARIDQLIAEKEAEIIAKRDNGLDTSQDEAELLSLQEQSDATQSSIDALEESIADGDFTLSIEERITDIKEQLSEIEQLNIEVVLTGSDSDLLRRLFGVNGSPKKTEYEKFTKTEPQVGVNVGAQNGRDTSTKQRNRADTGENPNVFTEHAEMPVEFQEASGQTVVSELQQEIDEHHWTVSVPVVADTSTDIDSGVVRSEIESAVGDANDLISIAGHVSITADSDEYDTLKLLSGDLEDSTEHLVEAWNNLQSVDINDEEAVTAAANDFRQAAMTFGSTYTSLMLWLKDKHSVEIDADTSGAESKIKKLNNITVTIKTNVVSSTVRSNTDVSKYARGTTNANPGLSLVDEKGAELIEHTRQGTFELGTNKGARFTNLEKGDVVHTASDTKKILKRMGSIGGFFRNGIDTLKGFFGKAFANGFNNKPVTGGAFATGVTGSFGDLLKELKKVEDKKEEQKKKTETTTKKTSASSTTSSTSKSASKVKNYVDNLFDWIEIRLERLQTITDSWINLAGSAIGYITKNNFLDKAFASVQNQIDESLEAYERYLQEADTIASKNSKYLTNDIIQRIKDGTIDISVYDSNTRDAIQDYQTYYEKALSALQAVTELQDQQKELAAQKLDNIIEYYDNLVEREEAAVEYAENAIDLLIAQGKEIKKSDYTKILTAQTNQFDKLQEKQAKLAEQFQAEMDEGIIIIGDDNYYKYLAELDDVNNAILEIQQSIIETNDNIANINITNLQYALSALQATASALSDIMSLHEAQGSDHTEMDYKQLIDNGMAQIKNLEAQNEELRKQQEGLEETSEKWQELQETIDSNNSSIMGIKVSQEQWNDAVLDLEINRLQQMRDELQKSNDAYNNARQMQDAILNLQKAQTQRTNRVLRNGEFVYEANEDAVRSAQEAFDQKLHEQTLSKIDDVIEAIEDFKDSANVYDANGVLLGQQYTLPSLDIGTVLKGTSHIGVDASTLSGITKAVYEQIVANAGAGKPVSMTIGDIHVEGVDSPDALAQALLDEFPNAMLQAIYSK